MGNEGFVAVKEIASGLFMWVLFSTCSNPFTWVSCERGVITAEAGYAQLWHIPLDAPEELSIGDVR